jgi:hypothetical protein
MTKQADWHWGVSNAGQSTVLLWLEPWADEVEVPTGKTATLRIVSAVAHPDPLEIEDTGEHVVIWAAGGDCVEVYLDGVLQHTGSASIPVPDGFGNSTKGLLGIMFDNQPKARLAGQQPTTKPPSLWGRLRPLMGRVRSVCFRL